MVKPKPDAPLILVVDDVSPVVRLIELELSTQGFRTRSILLIDQPVERALDLQPAAIVLGSSLPSPRVYDVLMRLKQAVDVPILFLHAGGNDNDAALALDMGADDTVALPFTPSDLSLHLRALLDTDLPEAQPIVRGSLRIDILRRAVWNGEKHVAVGTSEWALLLALADAKEPVMADDLLASVWGDEYRGQTAFLGLWIDRLRSDLGDDLQDPQLVVGDDTSGYRLA